MEKFFEEIEKFVFNLFNDKLDSKYLYHNLAHTQRVVEKVQELLENLKLDKTTSENLLIAAWFHDVGYINGSENHEAESVKIATDFLLDKKVSKKRIEEISKLILATQMYYLPINDSEKNYF